jgi:hypothetical protein
MRPSSSRRSECGEVYPRRDYPSPPTPLPRWGADSGRTGSRSLRQPATHVDHPKGEKRPNRASKAASKSLFKSSGGRR